MTTMYVVTTGEYSDYRIANIFSTRRGAQEYARAVKRLASYDNPQIEPWDVDVPRKSWIYTRVLMDEDGTLVGAGQSLTMDAPAFVGPRPARKSLCWYVATTDTQGAIKVVAEKVAILRNMEAWGNNKILREMTGGE